MSQLIFYHLPDLLLVVVSAWLGLGLLVRASRSLIIRAFAVFCAHMVLYGITAIQYQLTTSQQIALVLGRLELAATMLTPPAFLYFICALVTTGRMRRIHMLSVGSAYAVGIALTLFAIIGNLPMPQQHTSAWTQWQEPRFPDGIFTWLSAGQRIVPLLIAIGFMWHAYHHAPRDDYERRLWRVLSASAIMGVVGAVSATIAREIAWSPAIPRLIIVLALLLFTYTVLTQRGLLTARTTQREFLYSVLGSILTIVFITVVMILEWSAGEVLHINIPLVSALSIIGLAAAFGPLGEWLRRQIDRRFYPYEFDYSCLLKSLSEEIFERGTLAQQLNASLSTICRALDVSSGSVGVVTPHVADVADVADTRNQTIITRERIDDVSAARTYTVSIQAVYGTIDTPSHLQLLLPIPNEPMNIVEPIADVPFVHMVLPLRHNSGVVGMLFLGARNDEYHEHDAYSNTERAILEHLCHYLTLTIAHARARDEHQQVMVALSQQAQQLREQQQLLVQQVADAMKAMQQEDKEKEHAQKTAQGLYVYALGTLRVEFNGEQITRWGGNKAGTYQAEALFAFLFDRRGKGISKDEIGEMIWSDLEIARADSAFHRTLAALRRTLEPGLRRGNESRIILYHHERYWLEPTTIAWCDVDEFQALVEQGTTAVHQQQFDTAIAVLEQAQRLYRNDYMNDCPFFGDSSYVEENRETLRERARDVHVMLGTAYEAHERVGEAASAYRQALALSYDDCPPAAAALSRLGRFTRQP